MIHIKVKKFLIGFFILLFTMLIYKFVQPVNSLINQMIFYLTSNNVDSINGYLKSYEGLAPLFSILLMIIQSVLFPLSNLGIILSNAQVFGWWQGAIISCIGIVIGSSVCFFISKTLLRDIIKYISKKYNLTYIDSFFYNKGSYIALMCRFIPFISFDLVSYLFGVTGVRFYSFFMATGIGAMPIVLIYSYIGKKTLGSIYTVVVTLMLICALMIFIYILKGIKKCRVEKN